MEIEITIGELMDRGKYVQLERKGIVREYALNEGFLSKDDTITLTEKQANQIDLEIQDNKRSGDRYEC